MQFTYALGATPINQDDIINLIPGHISNQDQLNEWEANNILEAETWLLSKRNINILSIKFLADLHKKMFGKTWKWAGKFRNYNTNIGSNFPFITSDLYSLLDELNFWINNKTYSIEEIAVRFHHKLVLIHPFPNGNGRHSRLVTDIFLEKNGVPRFTWGSQNLVNDSDVRSSYINALRKADNHNYSDLEKFVRT